MRKFISFLGILTWLASGCNKKMDTVVAEAFHKKLYLSEVVQKIPHFTTKEDSLFFIDKYVDDWIVRQTLLAQAKKELTTKEQNFSSSIEQYNDQLLINAYFQKKSNHPSLFEVSRQELEVLLQERQTDETPEYRDMVKLNYVKLSNPSKLYKKIKDLFFDDKERPKSLAQIEKLCADTIEYYLDSDHWFYADYIEKELPFSFSELEKNPTLQKLDIAQNGYRYLILILDKKQQLQPRNVAEDKKIAKSLIQQQKRTLYICSLQDSLVKKATIERKVVRYPIHF